MVATEKCGGADRHGRRGFCLVDEAEDRREAAQTAMTMENIQAAPATGKVCRLLKPVRDHDGRSRFQEQPRILREINNLDRRMFLVQFPDGATTFLFPDEVVIG